jgi:predicted nucleotidyltransferase component of viral defense system
MIPALNIIAWSQQAPWAEQRQVEQDLIISRALVALFGDPFLTEEQRFRGGTALNKLHFPKPLRYSEDIDLVRTTSGPIGPVLSRLRDVLDPWLGQPKFDQSSVAPKFKYAIEGEDKTPIRLKIEINTRERDAFDPIKLRRFKVENPWFSGAADIPIFSDEELLATKLRALLQRKKGRDLIDLSHAMAVFEGLDVQKVVDLFGRYLAATETTISRTQAEQRMFAKLDDRNFMADVRPLLAADEREAFDAAAARTSFITVFDRIICLIPGAAWVRTDEMRERFGL